MIKLITTVQIIMSFVFTSFSQENQQPENTSKHTNDSLCIIFSSKSFTMEEDYMGDWGGYLHKFIFTLNGNKVRVQWENPELLKNGKDLDILLPITELNNLENIFIDCSAKIKHSKRGSTEHILYKFQSENITYVIDDKFTLECNDNFNAWKEMILSEWKKQEKK